MTAATTNGSKEVPPQRLNELPAEVSSYSPMVSEVHLRLLTLLEQNPAWTQRQLADALGVSLGKTNFCLRALRDKGLVKWGNFTQNSNKLQYVHLLTPKGIAEKLQLTAHFLQRKEREFEELRSEIERMRAELGVSNHGSGPVIAVFPCDMPLCSKTEPRREAL
jgi:EPS-associated MarR family transcriptional regulator